MKTLKKNSANKKPWPWHKAILTAVRYPNIETGQAILLEGNISVRRSFLWAAIGIMFCIPLYMAALILRNPLAGALTGWVNLLFNFTVNVLIILGSNALLSTGEYWFLRLFTKKGSWSQLVVLLNIFLTPYLVLFTVIALINQLIVMATLPSVGLIISAFVIFYILPLPIRVVYQIRWVWAFLISITIFILMMIGYWVIASSIVGWVRL